MARKKTGRTRRATGKNAARASAKSHKTGRADGKPKNSNKAPVLSAGAVRPLVVGGPHARMNQRKPLARELLALYGELGRLSRATRDEAERLRLREQQDALGVQVDEVIARTIRDDTEAYREATTAIIAAARRIEDALANLALVADAIVGAARVVDAVAKVLAAAVGPIP